MKPSFGPFLGSGVAGRAKNGHFSNLFHFEKCKINDCKWNMANAGEPRPSLVHIYTGNNNLVSFGDCLSSGVAQRPFTVLFNPVKMNTKATIADGIRPMQVNQGHH